MTLHSPWFGFHCRLLDLLERRYRVSFEEVGKLLTGVMKFHMPKRGETFFLDELEGRPISSSVEKSKFKFTRPSDELQSDVFFYLFFYLFIFSFKFFKSVTFDHFLIH